MAVLPVIANTYRCAIHWTGPSGLFAVNVIHVAKTASTAGVVATTIDSNVTQAMWAGVSNAWVADTLSITPLDGSSATFVMAVSGTKWTGNAGVSDSMPAVAPIVTLATVLRGRSHRGRIFLPPGAESNFTNGLFSIALTTSNAAWVTFLAALISATCPLQVASYKLASISQVTSAIIETKAATQRRRQGRLR